VPVHVQSAGPDAPASGAVVAGALVAGLVGAVGLTVLWAHRRWALPLAALYSRIRRNRMLDHPTRAALHALVATRPGLTLAEAQRELSLANGQLEHHVRSLERASLVRRVRDANSVRLYDAASASRAEAAPPLAERVRELAPSGRSAADIARELGVSRQAVHYHLRRDPAGTSR